MTLANRIIELLRENPGLSDRQITDNLLGLGKPQQSINITCRNLEQRGVLRRQKTIRGPIGNFLTGQELVSSEHQKLKADFEEEDNFSEDSIKLILEEWLIAQGWDLKIAWGHNRGIDIDATKQKERWIIEVKGEGSLNAMRVNYFLGILGETLQRMEDPNAKYSIALPDLDQFKNLWRRLPFLAKSRTGITAIFVDRNKNVIEIP